MSNEVNIPPVKTNDCVIVQRTDGKFDLFRIDKNAGRVKVSDSLESLQIAAEIAMQGASPDVQLWGSNADAPDDLHLHRLVAAPCVQCGRPGVTAIPPDHGQYVNVCYDHYLQWEAMRMRKIEMYREMAEQAEDDMADIVGLPRKVRPARIPAPRVNVQQINVQGHNYGVVNQGTVGSIENHLSAIHARRTAQGADGGGAGVDRVAG